MYNYMRMYLQQKIFANDDDKSKLKRLALQALES